ncbi:MAG: alkaline phosphatase, partial [Stackebrandtia sp.]
LNKRYRPEPDNTPHLLYGDDSHGYAVATLTADEWRTDFRAVSTVNRPEAQVRTVSSWVVENGEPGAVRA